MNLLLNCCFDEMVESNNFFLPEKLLLEFGQVLPQPSDHLHGHIHLSIQGPLSSLTFLFFLSQQDKSCPNFQQFGRFLGQLFDECIDYLLHGPVYNFHRLIKLFSDVGLESSFGV